MLNTGVVAQAQTIISVLPHGNKSHCGRILRKCYFRGFQDIEHKFNTVRVHIKECVYYIVHILKHSLPVLTAIIS